MPKSLKEVEKRKCEESHIIFMRIDFREYKEMDCFPSCDNAYCHSGMVIGFLERYLPQQRLYELLQYGVRIQLTTQKASYTVQASHRQQSWSEEKTSSAFKIPQRHPLLMCLPN